MKIQKMNVRMFLLAGILFFTTTVFSQDPNFYIFLAFGQSNMEGQGSIEPQDNVVDSRFQVMEALDCSNLGRIKGSWYKAVPPLCRCNTGLSPVDFFGKTMVANLPDSIRVGVINVSVAGCKIELYDKDNYQTYAAGVESWMKDIINNSYGGNPYGRLVEVAQLAKNDGVIKGILLHQGESNTNDPQWTSKVKGVYDDLLHDLGLDSNSVPLLAGEVVNADQGGVCAQANSQIALLPDSIPNAYVISSSHCSDAADNLHFNASGYREIGRRYAVKMLSLLGVEINFGQGTKAEYFEPECATIGDNWEIVKDGGASNGTSVSVVSGLNSTSVAPDDSASSIYFPFTIDSVGNYDVFARLSCPTTDDDSYWVKIDTGSYVKAEGLGPGSLVWKKLNSYPLEVGEHTLTVAYCEDGSKLDKICISNYLYLPSGAGITAANICIPDTATPVSGVIDVTAGSNAYTLGQNYPNPFNSNTTVSFEIPNRTFVSIKVYNLLGEEIAELAGKEFSSGKHTVEFEAKNLSTGIYIYNIRADKFSASRKMVLHE